ncbi:tetratricopeptide repeat protein [Tolypothrix sp. FACHB-123]|uniref:tetratricopeptide repeat protein n=1 Tax=Tolypothrix sp. FACHB-123 TaxID=2692868 RepID=UPI001F54D133|nr:tetratricopeptide repeat protein [Tolypothrix sp. FACHB-123]
MNGLLLVLDDFEQNIPTVNIKDGSLRMTADAYKILEAICAALAENGGESRLIVTCRYLQSDTLPPHHLHLESLAGMNSSDIDKICFALDKEVKQQLRTQRILKIADGNPRLLKWLLEVINQPGLAADELLNRLEATQQKFREHLLARTLFDALETEEQNFLARLSVFNLPVTEEIIQVLKLDPTSEIPPTPLKKGGNNITSSTQPTAAPTPPTRELEKGGNNITSSTPLLRGSPQAGGSDAGLVQRLSKLVSLSLVESATTHPNQPVNYRVARILELLLEPILTEEEWQATRQQAVKKIYQAWWEENEQKTEVEALEIVRLGLLAKEQEITASIGARIANNWMNKSRFVEALDLCKQMLAVFSDYRILGNIARAENVLGLVQEAVTHYQQTLDLCPEKELQEKAITLNNMAGVYADQGDIPKAIALWQQSLEISEQIGHVKGKATTLNNMAQVYADQGDIPKAIALYEQSLEISEQTGDVQGKAPTLNNMAQVFADQGDIPKAITLWEQSLEISEQTGDVQGKATTLNNMAGVYADQGDIPKAIALWEQSLEISEQIGDVKGKATTLNNMAGVFAQQGDIPKAITLWEQSLEISEQTGDVQGKATTFNNMAGVYADQGDIPKAIALWEQSLEISEQTGDVQDKATTLNNMAGVFAHQGDITKAIVLYEQSLEICEQIGDVKLKATTLNNMAQVFANQGEITKAIALWQQSLEISEQIGNVQGKATILNNMAQVIAQQGDIPRAIALWQQSLEISEQIGDVKGKAITLNNMAGLFVQQGDITKAIALWEEVPSTLAQIRAYGDLVTVLGNLGIADESNGLVYLAQAIWLTLRIQVPLASTINRIRALYNRVPQDDELEAILGATAMFFCNDRGEGHPELEEQQERSWQMLAEAAGRQGIETQEAFDAWYVQQRLNDPDYFLPRLNQRLEEIVGDGWLFDRSQVVAE